MSSLFHTVFALLLVLVPSVASACPSCMAQETGFSNRMKALAVMLLFPFVVAFFVIRAVKKVQRELRGEE